MNSLVVDTARNRLFRAIMEKCLKRPIALLDFLRMAAKRRAMMHENRAFLHME
jgi:hypothetical protein